MNSSVAKVLARVGASQRMLLAVSGGGDSLAMLAWFATQREWRNRIVCAHVDHMLQEHSAEVCAFVRDYSAALGVPFVIRQVDVPAQLSRKNDSLEACARRLRYAALEDMRGEHSCDYIVTAHTQDDDAETVWMKLSQNSSWFEVTGIPTSREKILRPFLFVPRHELRSVLDQEKAAHEDPMNQDSRFPRVRARAALATLGPDPAAAAVALCRHAQAIRKLLTFTERFLNCWNNNKLSEDFLTVSRLESLPKNLYLEDLDFLTVESAAKRLLDAPYFRFSAPIRRQVLDVLKSARTSSVLSLGNGLSLHRTGRHTWVAQEFEAEITLQTQPTGFVWTPGAFGKVFSGYCELSCAEVVVRKWRPGETFRPAKRRTRKISDWLSEGGVHPSVRSSWPVVCHRDTIVAVPGLGVREDMQPRANEPAVRLTWRAVSYSDQQVSR